MFHFLDILLFVYSSILRLLLVACCQLNSSTMGILLSLHLSRQHITVLSLLIAFNTLFLSRLPLFSPVVDVIHL